MQDVNVQTAISRMPRLQDRTEDRSRGGLALGCGRTWSSRSTDGLPPQIVPSFSPACLPVLLPGVVAPSEKELNSLEEPCCSIGLVSQRCEPALKSLGAVRPLFRTPFFMTLGKDPLPRERPSTIKISCPEIWGDGLL